MNNNETELMNLSTPKGIGKFTKKRMSAIGTNESN